MNSNWLWVKHQQRQFEAKQSTPNDQIFRGHYWKSFWTFNNHQQCQWLKLSHSLASIANPSRFGKTFSRLTTIVRKITAQWPQENRLRWQINCQIIRQTQTLSKAWIMTFSEKYRNVFRTRTNEMWKVALPEGNIVWISHFGVMFVLIFGLFFA